MGGGLGVDSGRRRMLIEKNLSERVLEKLEVYFFTYNVFLGEERVCTIRRHVRVGDEVHISYYLSRILLFYHLPQVPRT